MRFLLFIALLFPFVSYAQERPREQLIPAICGPEDQMFEKIEGMGYGNKVIFTGVSEVNPGVATQIIVDEERGTFTVLNWYPSAKTVCVFNNGLNYVVAWQSN